MRKSLLTTAAILALSAPAAAVPVLAAPAAGAESVTAAVHRDTEGCVTKAEFRGVRRGWSITRVHNRFDTAGRLTSQFGAYKTREYRSCTRPRWSYISISYDHRRVDTKSAYWA